MKKILFIAFLVLFSSKVFAFGAKDWVYLNDYDVKLPILVAGTYAKGSNMTEPRPVKSKYFQVTMGGMVVIDRGAGFFLNLKLKKAPKKNLYIEIEYPNPKTPQKPFMNSIEYDQSGDEFRLSSPDVIKGIAGYGDYDVKVRAYDKESNELVDSFVQKIRAYVDTREENLRIFKKVLNTIL